MTQQPFSGHVVVDPALKLHECQWFKDTVAEHLKLRLVEITNDSLPGASAAVLHDGSVWRNKASQSGINLCIFCETGCQSPPITKRRITFTDSSKIPAPCRKREIDIKTASPSTSPSMGEVVVFCDQMPLWTVERCSTWEVWRFQGPRPRLGPTDSFFHNLREEQFAPFIFLWSFLKSLDRSPAWQAPEPCACIVIDDPNLHAFTYGHVDYRSLAKLSRESGCHLSIATIPLDLFYIKTEVARFFREHGQHLSLLYHGNDHTRQELGRTNERDARRLIGQAMARVRSFESRYGVQVSRVMAPPHGAFSDCVAKVLNQFGFEAVCSSYGALESFNPQEQFIRSFGAGYLETMHGLLVLPRFGMTENLEFACFVSAFFGRHFIPSGHQEDFADENRVRRVVEAVNRYSGVKWTAAGNIAKRGYRWRRVGEAIHIEFLGKSLDFKVPENTGQIYINARQMNVSLNGASVPVEVCGSDVRIPVCAGDRLAVCAAHAPLNDPEAHQRRTPPAAYLRRFTTEIKARLSPYISSI